MQRVLALVDGEHYPPTTRWALTAARAVGSDVVAALVVGGTEKVAATGAPDLGDVPVETVSGDLGASLRTALDRYRPDAVLDLSDEPVLGYRERMLAVAVTLAAGVRYVGPDFAFEPPFTGPPLETPTVAVIGTGKRTGKTAIAAELARVAAANRVVPILVAMGRGGPPAPQVVEGGTVDLGYLREMVGQGRHAASDYLEDALTTGVTTIGARRAGGGLAGAPYVSNVREAARIADRSGAHLVVLEGSGAAVPPVPWDAAVLVAPAAIPSEYLAGYFGPYRLLISDVVVFTMAGGPDGGPRDLSDLESHVRRLRPDARIVITDFRPVPLGEVGGKKVYFATTAPPGAVPKLAEHLERAFDCSVVGASHRLSDRAGLAKDLEAAPAFEVLLTELKAAAVDVAADRAAARGAEVVFVDNRAETLGGDGELPEILLDATRLAVERSRSR